MSKKSNFFDKVRVVMTKQLIYLTSKKKVGEETFLFREVRYTDIRQLIAIEKDAYEGDVPWGKTAFLSELNGPQPVLYLIVEHEGQAVAFIGVRFEQEDGHITNVAVLHEYQGRGLATILLEEVIEAAKRSEYASLSLEVRISNMDAQRLYRKLGFVSRTVKKNYYLSNGEDALDMLYVFEERK